MSYLDLLKLAAPEAMVVVTALIVLTVGLTNRRALGASALLALLGIAATIGVILGFLPDYANLFNGMLVVSPLNTLFQVVCLVLAGFAVILASGDRSLAHHAEYLAMLLFATVGLMLLVSAEELLMIFVGLELTGLSLYLITSFDKSSLRGAEAGLKYFLFGSTASAFTLFGLSLVYGSCGKTSFAAIAQALTEQAASPLLAAGLVMTLIGLAFKVAAAPFHLWAPDTYQGAPIPSAAFIASGSKVASFVVLGKLLLLGFGALHGSAAWHAVASGWAPVLAVLAALSILLGNFVALAQKNVRRLLAYSAVAHAGYTLLGLVAVGGEGFAATLFYTTVYAFTLVGAFGVVAVVRRNTGGDDFTDFAGLRARSPGLAGCMAIFMLSLAGLPPLPGFFGKFYLFAAALRNDPQQGLLWLVILALFGSLISLYYYLIVLKVIFVDEISDTTPNPFDRDPVARISLTLLAILVLLFGLMPGPFVARILAALS